MANILLTGGTGFLGLPIAAALRTEHELMIVSRDIEAAKQVVNAYLQYRIREPIPKDKFIGADLVQKPRKEEGLVNAIKSADVIIHNAGLVKYGEVFQDAVWDSNFTPTQNIAHLCTDKRLIVTSSASVYGANTSSEGSDEGQETLIRHEEFEKQLGVMPQYFYSKAKADRYVRDSFGKGKAIIIRPGSLVGPLIQSESGKIKTNTSKLLKFARLPVYPTFEGGASFAHVEDVAALYAIAVNHILDPEYNGVTILNAGGTNTTLNDFVAAARDVMGLKFGAGIPSKALANLAQLNAKLGTNLFGYNLETHQIAQNTFYVDSARAMQMGYKPRGLEDSIKSATASIDLTA